MSLAYADLTENDVTCRRAAGGGGSSNVKGCGRGFGDATAEGDAENPSLAPQWVPSPRDGEAGREWGEVGSTEPVNKQGFHAAKQLESPVAKKPAVTDVALEKCGGCRSVSAGDGP